MRPRIKRSITRDGLVDHQVQRENTDNRPRREGNRRPEGGQQRSQGSSGKPGRGFQKRDSRTGKPAQPRTGRNEGGYGNKAAGKGNRTKKTARPGASPEKKFQYRIKTEHPRTENKARILPMKEDDGTVRLNKFIANSGICSRREADNFILAGVVTVNGQVVTELGTKININTDDVRFNGERIRGEKKVYIVMNKPKGFVTTTSDPHAEKTVMDLLKGCKSRVFSVGRLDKNTTGVLMFTNDGEMAEKLTHPSYNKKKIYQVTLNNELSQEDFDKILGGVMLTDGEIAADELEYIDDSDHKKIGIEIHSGKNRIVRRIFESLGYEVKALDRVYFAGLTKKGLKKGQWRYLSEGEVNILKMGSYQ